MTSVEQIEKITAIVALLDEHLESIPKDNRRQQPRLAIRMPLVVGLLTSSGPVPVDIFLRNISPSGMGFVSRRMFRADERVAVLLQLPKLASKQVLARVTFARYVRSGLYEMGAEFLQSVNGTAADQLPTSALARIPSHWLLNARQARPAPEPPAAAPQVKVSQAQVPDPSKAEASKTETSKIEPPKMGQMKDGPLKAETPRTKAAAPSKN